MIKDTRIARLITALGPLFGLLFVMGLFALSSEVRPFFFTGGNFKIILTQTVIVAVAALGMTLIIVSGGIDLSVGSVVALTSVVAARLVLSLTSPILGGDDLRNVQGLAARLHEASDPVSRYVAGRLTAETRGFIAGAREPGGDLSQVKAALVREFNAMITSVLLHEDERFAQVTLRRETRHLLDERSRDATVRLNRLLLEDAFPEHIRRIPSYGMVIALASIVSIATGGLIGLLNGITIAGFRMMPFIVTLGMMGVVRGTAKWMANNQTVNPPSTPLNNLMALSHPQNLFPLPVGVWMAIGLAVVMAIVLRQTVFGRYIFAIGSNEATARLCGVRVPVHKLLIYSLAGLFFGLAGLMQFSRLTQGDPSVAIGLELDIIAAVVIGGASLSGGTGSITGSMIGALMMAVLRNGSNQMGWPTYMQEIIIGIVIVLAVGLDKWRQSRAARKGG